MRTPLQNRNIKISLFVLFIILPVIYFIGCQEGIDEDTGSRGIFYEIEGAETELYLFGSVHVGNEEMYPLQDRVMEAFEGADLIAMEIDLESINEMEMAEEMMEVAMYQDGRRMSEVVGEDTFEELVRETEEYGVGPEVLELFKPWYGAMFLTEVGTDQSEFSQEYGVEQFFLDNREGQELIGLEEVMDQLRPFTEMSEETQVEYLKQTLEEMETFDQDLSELIDEWKAGNAEYFEGLRSDVEEDEAGGSLLAFQQALTDDRDEDMAKRIAQLMESGEHEQIFVVVGSLHLVGDLGITRRLEEMGYEVID